MAQDKNENEYKEHPMRISVAEINPDALFMDGHDDAIIGVASRCGMNDVACYDYDKVIAKHIEEGMSEEEAIEHFSYNQIGGWVGDNTPVFVRLLPPASE
jgi:hypothetical protein